jgi:hypothetical protein
MNKCDKNVRGWPGPSILLRTRLPNSQDSSPYSAMAKAWNRLVEVSWPLSLARGVRRRGAATTASGVKEAPKCDKASHDASDLGTQVIKLVSDRRSSKAPERYTPRGVGEGYTSRDHFQLELL